MRLKKKQFKKMENIQGEIGKNAKIMKDQMHHLLVLQCFLSSGLHPTFGYMLAGFTTDYSSLFALLALFLISKSHIPFQITKERKKKTTDTEL